MVNLYDRRNCSADSGRVFIVITQPANHTAKTPIAIILKSILSSSSFLSKHIIVSKCNTTHV